MIRDACSSDASEIAMIWNAVIEETSATFTTELKTFDEVASLIDQGPTLVVENDGAVAGFARFGPFRSGPGYRFVAEHSIYLARSEQGGGQGRTLLATLEARAREAGIDTFVAGIGGENVGARAFHEAMGYVQVGVLPSLGEKFGRRHDLVFMQKALV